jgi:hypothetical protein
MEANKALRAAFPRAASVSSNDMQDFEASHRFRKLENLPTPGT